MSIQFAMTKKNKCPVVHLVSFSNIWSLLSNRTYRRCKKCCTAKISHNKLTLLRLSKHYTNASLSNAVRINRFWKTMLNSSTRSNWSPGFKSQLHYQLNQTLAYTCVFVHSCWRIVAHTCKSIIHGPERHSFHFQQITFQLMQIQLRYKALKI